jgi:hypothetical protein
MTPQNGVGPFDKVQHPQKRALLVAYAECGLIGAAASAAGCDRTSHYVWLKNDPDYAEAFKMAHELAILAHEDEASRRAMGWDETHYAADGTSYTIRKYSDTMLIVRLKALKPEVYRDALRRDERTDVSELLKAVLLELADRSQARDVTPEAEWAPVPPGPRQERGPRPSLPAPPDVDEEG